MNNVYVQVECAPVVLIQLIAISSVALAGQSALVSTKIGEGSLSASDSQPTFSTLCHSSPSWMSTLRTGCATRLHMHANNEQVRFAANVTYIAHVGDCGTEQLSYICVYMYVYVHAQQMSSF